MSLSDDISMHDVVQKWNGCMACRLGQPGTAFRRSIVFGDGNAVDPKILIVGEAPGPEEDKAGVPFVGKTGKRLRRTLVELGCTIERDCFITNSVLCYPYDQRSKSFRGPLGDEILACRQRFEDQWGVIGKSVRSVLLLGKRPYASFFLRDLMIAGALQDEGSWNKTWLKMTSIVGWQDSASLRKKSYRVMASWHPSYIERSNEPETSSLVVGWKADIKAAIDWALHGVYVARNVHVVNESKSMKLKKKEESLPSGLFTEEF